MVNTVMLQLRCQLKDCSFQKQVAVTYNSNQTKRTLGTTRGAEFDKVLATLCETGDAASDGMIKISADDDVFDLSILEEELVRLETSLIDISTPDQIPDELIFFENDKNFFKNYGSVSNTYIAVQNSHFKYRFKPLKRAIQNPCVLNVSIL